MHVSSYTLSGRLKGDMHTKKGLVLNSAVRWEGTGLTFTLPLDDANIDQALLGPPFYRDIVQESTEIFTSFHLVGKTHRETRGGGVEILTTVSDERRCVFVCVSVSDLCVLWRAGLKHFR